MDIERLVQRLHRIEGQVRGVERMCREKRDIVTIVQQLDAVRGATHKLIVQILIDDVLAPAAQKNDIPAQKLEYLKKFLQKQI